jgi:hypothetical protein
MNDYVEKRPELVGISDLHTGVAKCLTECGRIE